MGSWVDARSVGIAPQAGPGRQVDDEDEAKLRGTYVHTHRTDCRIIMLIDSVESCRGFSPEGRVSCIEYIVGWLTKD